MDRKTLIRRPRLRAVYVHRAADDPMGRFGGGWQWKLGVQAGRVSWRQGGAIVNLLVSYVRVEWGLGLERLA
jgi:hypothetical protein